MKHANDIAHRRDREGLQIQNDHIGDSYTKSKSTSTSSNTANPHQHQQSSPAPAATTTRNPTQSQSRGYQVNEYDVRAYDTNSYEVKEYKSVYDWARRRDGGRSESDGIIVFYVRDSFITLKNKFIIFI